MKRIAIALTGGMLGLTGGCASPARAAPPPPPAQAQAASPVAASLDLEAIARQAMAETGAPALGVLVIRDGRVAGQAVQGVRRLGGADPARADDLWAIGSNGKAFTATLIARLVEEGRLSWTAPLSQMLPELAAKMRPEYRDVTLVDLLSHRAGLREPDTTGEGLLTTFYDDPAPLPRQRLRWVEAALALEPTAPRGTASRYSNTGYLIAAAAAEHATGETYEALLGRLVLEPLGLRSVVFGPNRAPSALTGHANGKASDGPRDGNPTMWAPAGGHRMTLADWAVFCIDQMNGRRGQGVLLSAEGYRRLHTAVGGSEALGWMVEGDFAGRRGPVLQHTGSDGHWFAAAALFPDTREGVLVVSNAGRSMGGDDAAMKAALPVVMTLSVPAGG